MASIRSIFPSWKSYTDAYCESLNTEFYFETYPEYAALGNELENLDLMIVKELLNAGYSPQEGLELFASACLKGPRYLNDMSFTEILQPCIDAFIEHGAKITQEMVDVLFTIEQFDDIVFEQYNVRARATMLDAYSKHNIDISSHGEWKTVEPLYWEYIPKKTEYVMQCRMYMKHCSKFLASA